VKARLRRASGAIGSHLSSGFDSSGVTASAAVSLGEKGETLVAFTSAPRKGFDAPVPEGRIADESAVAAATVKLHPNIDHVVVRPNRVSPLSLLSHDHRDAGQPVGHVCNNLWVSAINEQARERGVTVMLTGEAGNFTISAGLALDQLPDFIRHRRLVTWARESRLLVRGDYGWKNILHASLAPWIPERLYLRLRGLERGFTTGVEDLRFVAPEWRAEMAAQSQHAGWDILPPRNSKDRRWKLLQSFDSGNFRKRSLARWGIEERDPTMDRRLVEFCFSLPAEAYLRNGIRRPAMRHALEGRIPAAVMEQKLRGYQMADWYEQVSGEGVRNFIRGVDADGAGDIVDLPAVRSAADRWPTGNWHHRPTIYLFRTKLLRALSASHFINSAGTVDG